MHIVNPRPAGPALLFFDKLLKLYNEAMSHFSVMRDEQSSPRYAVSGPLEQGCGVIASLCFSLLLRMREEVSSPRYASQGPRSRDVVSSPRY